MKTEHTPDNFWQDEARRYAQNADYWQAERDRLKAANAEMLEALKTLLFNVEHGNGLAAWDKSKDKARVAIKKAEAL